MNIVIAYNYDPSNLRCGGGITYVHNLLKSLLSRGLNITLFGVKLSKNQTFTHPNLEFISILEGTDNWWKFLIKLYSTLRSDRFPDYYVIHTHHPLVMYPFVRFLPDNPKVCTFHGVTLDWVRVNYPHFYSLVKHFYSRIEERMINNVDIITTAGNYPKQGLEKRYPNLNLDKKLITLPSGVDLSKFKPIDKSKLRKKYGIDKFDNIILFAGRLSEQKNLPLLLKSFSLVESKLENSLLVIVGRGEKETEIKRLSSELNTRNILFIGEVRDYQVPELLNCADVVALTSWYEASPTIVKEALACGVPVVTTNVGDVHEIITNPLLGTIVDRYDEKLFAEALIKTIETVKAKPEEVRERCREVALERFSFEVIAEKFIEIYKQAMKKRCQK